MAAVDIKNYKSANKRELVKAFEDVVTIAEKIHALANEVDTPETGYKARILASIKSAEELGTFYQEIFGEKGHEATINASISKFDGFVQNAEGYAKQVKDFYNQIFTAEGDEKSTEGKIQEFSELIEALEAKQIKSIKDFHQEIYGENGYKQTIEADKNLVSAYKAKSESIYKEIDKFNSLLFVDMAEDNRTSIRSQISDYQKDIKNFIDSEIKDIKGFHSEIFGTEEEVGTQKKILNLQVEIEGLKKKSEALLSGLTDESLHDSFSKRAQAYTDEHTNLRRFSSIILIALSAFYIWILQGVGNDGIKSEDIFYQISLAIPLAMLVWFLNRDQKIAKKLAEEYHHKSSISAAIVGYRKMYKLTHEDEEYLKLFECIKDQLNENPSESIDKFLLLNSPPEKVIDAACKSLNDASEKLSNIVSKTEDVAEGAQNMAEEVAKNMGKK